MITFNEKEKTFLLTNNSISLFIYINANKHLETVYFGKASKDISLENNRKKYEDNYSTCYFDHSTNKDMVTLDGASNHFSRFELATHSVGDHRPAPIIIQKKDGNYETAFEYVSHRIYKGYPHYEENPHAHDGNIETLEITLKDEFDEKLIAKYNISIDLDKDIIVKNIEFKNQGEEQVKILRALSMELDLEDNNYVVHHFRGKWGRERGEVTNPIIDGEQIIASNYGRSSHEENPFIFLAKQGADYSTGEVIGLNIIYSGNFKCSIFSDYANKSRITYGLNDYNFCWLLSKNETFITPQAVICYSENGIDHMSQTMHRFVKENVITYKKDNEYKPILFNSWEGSEMSFNTESIIAYIDDSIKIGSELFVLDDGWFSYRNDDTTSLGDWWVNKDKIDLDKVIKHCHKNNLKFGIWFEPEMISYESELYKNHPEYAVGYTRNKQALQRHQFLLDMCNDEAVNNIYLQMKKVIDEYDIDYIKWDHNRDLKETFIPHLGNDRQGEVTHRLVLGYYKLIERLTKEYPNIMFEGCASGGGRFDLGTLYYCPQIWASDNSRPASRMFIQYNTSLGYPLSCIGSHVNASEQSSYTTKAYLSLFGTYGYEMNPNYLSNEEKEELNFVANIYKEYHKELFEEGILYHLASPTEKDYMSMQVVNKDATKSALIVTINEFKTHFKTTIKLKGLSKDKNYLIITKDSQKEVSGKSLLEKGLDISIDNPNNLEVNSYFALIKQV